MGKRKSGTGASTSGTIALVAGFVIFLFGLLIVTGHPAFLRSGLTVIIQDSLSLDLSAVILLFGGGLIGLLGVFRLIKSLTSEMSAVLSIAYAQRNETINEITSLRASLSDMMALMVQQVAKSKRRCKYCGAEMEEGTVFCSVCNKSQA